MMDNLSIVFQGPVTQNGLLCNEVLRNIRLTRTAFPDAEIIVSTWYCSPETEHLLQSRMAEIDVYVVLSYDPGPIVAYDESGMWISNLNRLRESSLVGLRCATRMLSLKLRTDTYLSGRDIIRLLQQYVQNEEGPIRENKYRVFKRRVINASWFARDARGSLPYLFHPGDILLAGLTEDLRLFFSAPLADSTLFSPAMMPGLWCAWQFVPEQWFWVHAIHKVTGKMEYKGNFAYTPDRIEVSERYYLANFVPFSHRQLKLHWSKYWKCYPLRGLFSLYTHSRWLNLSGKYLGYTVEYRYIFLDRALTRIWRAGYILRARVLLYPSLRRIARALFVHRNTSRKI